MNFIIINSLIGIFIMFISTIPMFKSLLRIKIITYIGLIISTSIAVCNFLNIQTILNIQTTYLEFTNFENLFLVCMQICFFLYLLLNIDNLYSNNKLLHEQIALLFFIFSGCAILISYTNLLMMFLGIEIVSIPLYILTGINKKDLKGNEAALKYFLLGALSTCILLMGICLVYGATASFELKSFVNVDLANNKFFIIGILLLIISFAFKVSAAPFHFWTPDIYEGAPTAYTSFMATIVKSFFLVAFLRLFSSNWQIIKESVNMQIIIIVSCTLIIGNFTAVFQQGFKRLMAYSSISQVGFMLLAILGSKTYLNEGILLYTVSYTIATIGIFAVISKSTNGSIDNLKGLSKSNPILSISLTIYLLSLAGIPLTAGFLSKYYLLLISIKNNIPIFLIVIIIISATISVFYYLRLIQNIYLQERTIENKEIIFSYNNSYNFLFLIISLIIIVLGIQPSLLLNLLNY